METNKENIKKYVNIENLFFDIDEEKKIAYIKYHYWSPYEIFNDSICSKGPIFSDDFMQIILKLLELIPNKCKVSFEINFDNMGKYDLNGLYEIFNNNIYLQLKGLKKKKKEENALAYSLIAAWLVFFVLMMLLTKYRITESYWHDVCMYFFDIATTVIFWEAAWILFVKNRENRRNIMNLGKKFHEINFTHE